MLSLDFNNLKYPKGENTIKIPKNIEYLKIVLIIRKITLSDSLKKPLAVGLKL